MQLSRLIVAGFLLVFFSMHVIWGSSRPLSTKILACSVGQGDAILILHGEKRILIDSGPNNEVLRCLSQVAFPESPRIDVAILTHWDNDHIGGFASVLQKYKIETVFVNPTTKATKGVEELQSLLAARGGSLQPWPGDSLIYPGLRIRFLWSKPVLRLDTRQKPVSAENGASIGVTILGQSFGFLSLGDLECEQELAVSSIPLLNSMQILKVSHHGAKTSTCLEFLQRVRPEIGIISAGAGNQYGHPHEDVLHSLEEMGVFVLRTDQRGDIELLFEPDRQQRLSAQTENFE